MTEMVSRIQLDEMAYRREFACLDKAQPKDLDEASSSLILDGYLPLSPRVIYAKWLEHKERINGNA